MTLLYDTTLAGVEARGQYRVWVNVADGTEGEVDLSGELTNDAWEGALTACHDPTLFAAVRIGNYGIAWGDDGDIIDIEDKWSPEPCELQPLSITGSTMWEARAVSW